MNLDNEGLIFNTALQYKEMLIYVYNRIKIYEIKYKNKIYFAKIDTSDNKIYFSFSKELLNLILKQELDSSIPFENYKLKKEVYLGFYGKGDKNYYQNISKTEFFPLLDLLFSVPLNGRPRKFFQNSFGKVMISNKEEKLTGHYKKIIKSNF